MDNNQIFKNCIVIIYCHLTKDSSQINTCIILEPNELYNTIYSMVITKNIYLYSLVITPKKI